MVNIDYIIFQLSITIYLFKYNVKEIPTQRYVTKIMKKKKQSYIKNIGPDNNLHLSCLVLGKLYVSNQLNWITHVLIKYKNSVVSNLSLFKI